MLDETSFLDPRFKALPYLSRAEKAKIEDRVARKMTAMYSTKLHEDNECSNISTTVTASNYDPSKSLVSSLLGDLFAERPLDVAHKAEDIVLRLACMLRSLDAPLQAVHFCGRRLNSSSIVCYQN